MTVVKAKNTMPMTKPKLMRSHMALAADRDGIVTRAPRDVHMAKDISLSRDFCLRSDMDMKVHMALASVVPRMLMVLW